MKISHGDPLFLTQDAAEKPDAGAGLLGEGDIT